MKLFSLLLIAPFFVGCSHKAAYRVDPLPDLGGVSCNASDINHDADIVGWCETRTGAHHAVIWKESGVIDLGTLGGANSYAYGINDSGEIVGFSETAGGKRHAFIWRNGTMFDIHHPDWPDDISSYAIAINNTSVIAGEAGTTEGIVWHALYEIQRVQDEGFHDNYLNYLEVHDINDAEQVAGWHYSSDQAFKWENGTIKILSDLGDCWSRAYGINNLGQVVGNISDPSDHKTKAVIWVGNDPPKLLGSLGGPNSTALDINDSGIVVGKAEKQDGKWVPFYFELSKGVMHELFNFIGGVATSVNESGIIVGSVPDVTGASQAVRWVWRY